MANRLYVRARQKFLDGDLSWRDDAIRAVLVDLADYAPDFANDSHLSDVPEAARVATSYALTGKTSNAGVADADDVTFPTVAGDVCGAIVVFADRGTAATSPLIAYVDTATNLPLTPDGSDVLVRWDDGAAKLFRAFDP